MPAAIDSGDTMNRLLRVLVFLFIIAVTDSFAQKVTGDDSVPCEIKSDREYLDGLLRVAISDNNVPCVREILRRGTRPAGRYKKLLRSEPISLASTGGKSIEIVDELFRAGLDPLSDEVREALFLMSASDQDLLIKRVLVWRVPVDGRSKNGETALMIAAANGSRNVVKLLIANKANLNAATKDGTTALMIASEDETSLDFLLDSSANMDQVDEKGRSALYYAIASSQIKKLEILLKRGADSRLRDNLGMTPLEYAIQIANPDVKQAIVDLLTRYSKETNKSREN